MDIFQRLREEIGPEARPDEPMWKHTSFRVGGPASLLIRAKSRKDLERLVPLIAGTGVPWRVLGGGTNVLVADAGVRECVILNQGDRFELRIAAERAAQEGPPQVVIDVPSGCPMATVARRTVDQGLAGLEWAVGLPGTVGGAVVNNAGAHGGDVASVLESVTAVSPSGQVVRLAAADMGYRYRNSVVKEGRHPGLVVASAEFRLRRGSREQLRAAAARFEASRRERQPTGLSAGSVFKNPSGDHAGRLIEAAGLKGLRAGGAQVSTLHGNFFLNTGGATARDLFHLARAVQDAVWEKYGVWLEPELQLIGEWAEEERRALEGPPASGRPS